MTDIMYIIAGLVPAIGLQTVLLWRLINAIDAMQVNLELMRYILEKHDSDFDRELRRTLMHPDRMN